MNISFFFGCSNGIFNNGISVTGILATGILATGILAIEILAMGFFNKNLCFFCKLISATGFFMLKPGN